MSNDCAMHTRAAYDQVAPFYDIFTAHHDYDKWTLELEQLARGCGMAGTRLLDVGCGTGKSFLPFVRRGWTVTASDVSPRMLECASAKAPGVELVACDMREMPALGEFDLVTCIDDGLNYLTEPGDLDRAFAAIARNLAPGGVTLFDVNTLATYRGFFASCEVIDRDDTLLTWRGLAPPDAPHGVLAEAVLSAFCHVGVDTWTRTDSHHRQRHHPVDAIEAALESAGLEAVAVYGQALDGKPVRELDERRHTKAVFIAKATERR